MKISDILDFNGTTFAGFVMETSFDSMMKKGSKNNRNPWIGRIKKVSHINGMLFKFGGDSHYQNMVNRRLAKEGKKMDFEAGSLPWGKAIDGTPFIEHNGNYYLRLIVNSAEKPCYVVDGTKVYSSRKELEKETGVDEWYNAKGKGETKEGEQGGLENKVIVRNYRLDSIREIIYNGVHFGPFTI